MFMTGMFTGTLFNAVDPDEEREPPPSPTPITFPLYETGSAADESTSGSLPALESLFCSIIRPGDIKPEHVRSLNIQVLPPVAINKLVVRDDSAVDVSNPTKDDHPLLERPELQKDLDDRLREVDISNDTALKILARKLPPTAPVPRLAYLRKFWSGLESMSTYWDCSLDSYRDISADEAENFGAKRVRVSEDQDRAKVIRSPFNSEPVSSPAHLAFDILPRRKSINAIADPSRYRRRSVPMAEAIASEETPDLPTKLYKGRRTNTGRNMPEAFRVDTARAFVEAVVTPFRCTVAAPRHVPVVQLGRLNMPVRQTAAVYEAPKTREAARQGRLTGPIMALQVRPETDFDLSDEAAFIAKSRLDFLRVAGELLQLGQERRRQGKSEIPPGTDKWWTTVPRWGATSTNHVEESSNEEILAVAQEFAEANKDIAVEFNGSRPSRPRRTPAMLWKELKCGTSLWDSRTDYKAIGKTTGSAEDELFLVSSLNHHISVVKLTVHDAYLDNLTAGGSLEADLSSLNGSDDPSWSRPRLEQSHWYDLMDQSQRVEAFRGLWAIMAYLTRDSVEPTQ